MDKERGYAEEDKATILDAHARLVAEVIPLHKRLQDEGRIEITMTPFFHPILPLLLDSNLASVAVPDAELPPRYTYGFDAVEQVRMGIDYYTETLWPAAPGHVARRGSRRPGDRRHGRPGGHLVDGQRRGGSGPQPGRDRLCPQCPGGRTGSRCPLPALDRQQPRRLDVYHLPGQGHQRQGGLYLQRRQRHRGGQGPCQAVSWPSATGWPSRTPSGPNLVSVILDGENAWEHYPNDGKEFLHTLYQLLEEEQEKGTIRTITPEDYVTQFPEQPELENLWAGSWVSPDYLTWIGEDEENRAWDYLGRVRAAVEKKKHTLDEETLAAVMDAIYTAEGSDWFWWYGADQNSGDDASFDEQFRRTLMRVYEIMGDPVPTFLKVPVIPQQAQAPEAGASALITPEIDGEGEERRVARVPATTWRRAARRPRPTKSSASFGTALTRTTFTCAWTPGAPGPTWVKRRASAST